MYELPTYVWILVLIGVVGIAATTSAALYRGAVAARLRRRTAVVLAVVAAYVLGGWIVATGLLAGAGVYQRESGEAAPWFGVAFGGVLIALLLATRIPLVRRILADPGTPARLALPHTFPPCSPCPPGWATSPPGWQRRSSPGGWPAAGVTPTPCGSTGSGSSTWSSP